MKFPLGKRLWAVVLPLAIGLAPASEAATRAVRAIELTVPHGQTNRLSVVLDAQADEHAAAFSLCYNTNLLTFLGAVRGTQATNAGATLTVNTSQALSGGRIGLSLVLPAGRTFATGSHAVVEAIFRAAPGTNFVATPVSVCNQPVALKVTDTAARTLTTTSADATVIIMGTCVYSLATNGVSLDAAGGTRAVALDTGLGCLWSVANTNAWITLPSGASRVGPGNVDLVVAVNPSRTPRAGVLMIAGQSFTVNQAGAPCTVELSPPIRLHGYGVASNSVSVTASNECVWRVLNLNDWITITSGAGGTGNGSVKYTVEANPLPVARTGLVFVADQLLTLSQQASACSYRLSSTHRSHGPGAVSNAVSVTTGDSCSWKVLNSNSWITITSSTNGTGNGTVTYQLRKNPSLTERIGVVTIAGQLFTVTQAGFECEYKISPAARTHGYGSSTGLVSVTTSNGCEWSVVNTNDWITINSDPDGIGSGNVGYAVDSNPMASERTGVVLLGGELFTLTQRAASCAVEISPMSRTHGYGAATGAVSVAVAIGCEWAVAGGNDWITITTTTNGSGPGTVAYLVAANPGPTERTGVVMIAGQTLTLMQRAAPCSVEISPALRTHGHAAASGVVSVTSITGCPWNVAETNDWITIISGTNGDGSGSVTYAVAANSITLDRMGVVRIADQSLTLVQRAASCEFVLSPKHQAHGAGAETALVSMATSPNCAWNVVNTNGWIATFGGSGVGNGAWSYAVSANPSLLARTGVLTVDGEKITVTQAGAFCTGLLGPTSGIHGAGSETGLVRVAALDDCQWVVLNTNDWIAIRSGASGAGPGEVSYTVDANQAIHVRSGLVMIAGAPYLVRQEAATCAYRLSPTNRVHGHGTASGTVGVITLEGCEWAVINTSDWITITSEPEGQNSGIVSYTIAANPTLLERTGVVIMADQILMLTQSAAPCKLAISPANRTHGFAGSTGAVIVTTVTGCPWTIENTNDWIAITSGMGGKASTSVNYEVAANPFPAPRSGVVRIGDELITLIQRAAPCAQAVAPAEVLHGHGAETGLVAVTTLGDCSWSVQTASDWISITSGTDGAGDGSVGYHVAANPGSLERSGLLVIDGKMVTLRQAGAPCTFAIAPAIRVHGGGMETGTVTVTTLDGCRWEIVQTNDWIIFISGDAATGHLAATYRVDANPAAWARTGVVSIASQTFTIRQDAASCAYALVTNRAAFGFGGGAGQAHLLTPFGCSWDAVSGSSWITITTGLRHTNEGVVSFTVASNATGRARSEIIRFATEAFTVSQGTAPEIVKPTVKITSPSPNARTTNATVSGIAQDYAGVASVAVAVGDGEFLTAEGTSPWLIRLDGILSPGTNVVRAKSMDVSGNESPVVTQRFFFIPTSPLTVRTNGHGIVTPNQNGRRLEVGRAYTIVATPGAGHVFSNWTGGVTARANALTFVMRSNLVLEANFVPNPFLPIKGSYSGLFRAEPLEHENSGFLSLTLTERGAFTAALLKGGRRLPFSGVFDLLGASTNAVSRPGTNALTVELLADLAPGGSRISGRVTDANFAAALKANRIVFHAVTNRATNFAGKYTLLLPGADDSVTIPGGDGFGTLTVDHGGNVRFGGTLADGTPVTQRGALSKDGAWPFYAPLYTGHGSLLGDVTLANHLTEDLSGAVDWIKPASATAKFYPGGFSHRMLVTGSRYTAPGTNNILGIADGLVTFQDGNLEELFTNRITLGAGNKITNLDSNKLTLNFTLPTGLFNGSATPPGGHKPVVFKGAIHQKQHRAAGFFLGTNQSGTVTLER